MFKKLTSYFYRFLESEENSTASDSSTRANGVHKLAPTNMNRSLEDKDKKNDASPTKLNGKHGLPMVVVIDSDDDCNNNNETRTLSESAGCIPFVNVANSESNTRCQRSYHEFSEYENASSICENDDHDDDNDGYISQNENETIETIVLSEEEEDVVFCNQSSSKSPYEMAINAHTPRSAKNLSALLQQRASGSAEHKLPMAVTTYRGKCSLKRSLTLSKSNSPAETEAIHNFVNNLAASKERQNRISYGRSPNIATPTSLPSFVSTEYSVELDACVVSNFEAKSAKNDCTSLVDVIEIDDSLPRGSKVRKALYEANLPINTKSKYSTHSPNGVWNRTEANVSITVSDDEEVPNLGHAQQSKAVAMDLNSANEISSNVNHERPTTAGKYYLQQEDEQPNCPMFEEVIISNIFDGMSEIEEVDCPITQPLVFEEVEISNRAITTNDVPVLRDPIGASSVSSTKQQPHCTLKRRSNELNLINQRNESIVKKKRDFLTAESDYINNIRTDYSNSNKQVTITGHSQRVPNTAPYHFNKPTSLRAQPKRLFSIDQICSTSDVMVVKKGKKPVKAPKKASTQVPLYVEQELRPTEPEGPVSTVELPPSEPTQSVLKKSTAHDATSSNKSNGYGTKKPTVRFGNVTVYLFGRQQGNETVPTRGGCCLGMEPVHSAFKEMTLYEYASEKQRSRPILTDTTTSVDSQGQRILLSDETDFDEDDEQYSDEQEHEQDQDYASYNARPLRPKERRALLRASGVHKIIRTDVNHLNFLRKSREDSGCKCIGYCIPEICSCSQNGIKCQEDELSYPCLCSAETCRNIAGRVMYNRSRIRNHYQMTMLKLKMEDDNSSNNAYKITKYVAEPNDYIPQSGVDVPPSYSGQPEDFNGKFSELENNRCHSEQDASTQLYAEPVQEEETSGFNLSEVSDYGSDINDIQEEITGIDKYSNSASQAVDLPDLKEVPENEAYIGKDEIQQAETADQANSVQETDPENSSCSIAVTNDDHSAHIDLKELTSNETTPPLSLRTNDSGKPFDSGVELSFIESNSITTDDQIQTKPPNDVNEKSILGSQNVDLCTTIDIDHLVTNASSALEHNDQSCLNQCDN